MIDWISSLHTLLADNVGGRSNANTILVGVMCFALVWAVLRAVRQGSAEAHSRQVQDRDRDPTLLLALRQAEARIHQLEEQIESMSETREREREAMAMRDAA